MTLEVQQVVLTGVLAVGVDTHQWQATVRTAAGRVAYRSCGYAYALEAKRAGEYWISLQGGRSIA